MCLKSASNSIVSIVCIFLIAVGMNSYYVEIDKNQQLGDNQSIRIEGLRD